MTSRPLTILHVVRAPIGGIFRHIEDLARLQTRAGHGVGIVCDSSTGGAFEAEHISALAPELAHGVLRIPMRRSIGPLDAGSLLRIRRHVAGIAPDIVHAHGSKGGVFGRLAAAAERARGRNIASFYAPHGGSLHYDARSAGGRLYFRVERAQERFTDGLLHVSAYEAEVYREKVGAPRCPAHVVHNGLAPHEFEPVRSEPDAADFLYIGMLRDLKGVDVFLSALAILKDSRRPAQALVVGDGEGTDVARYREIVRNAGLNRQVAFHPPMPARDAFRRARAIVVPSRAESMPYIVLEAAAAGLPMIATRVGGIPEIFEGEADRLVTPGDARALAGAMAQALDDPARLAGEAAARRERLRSGFSIDRMAERIERLYADALATRAGRGAPAPAEAVARQGGFGAGLDDGRRPRSSPLPTGERAG